MGHWPSAVERLTVNHFRNAYKGKRVLVTGHTGFKGSWLALWLTQLGAEVAGYSLDIPSEPSHFVLIGLEKRLRHYVGDIRDRQHLAHVIDEFKPQIIFHLAAQALVRRSYTDPVETFETNTMGMVNVMECIRTRPWIETVVLITSDKAYRNVEWCWGYRETDMLGGFDPYGASKSCADIVAQSYYHAFLKDSPTKLAITRAGNVIGGGDWAQDRIVPDCIRAWSENKPASIRSPQATRPWQHVLEPVSGYLWLGAKLREKNTALSGEAFNFGPDARVNQTVSELLDAMVARWPSARWEAPKGQENSGQEAMLLKLSCDKALQYLQWEAVLDFDDTVAFTVDWYKHWREGKGELLAVSQAQIEQYCDLAKTKGAVWL
jgi:CDP-glucose 4,6-dehydratase